MKRTRKGFSLNFLVSVTVILSLFITVFVSAVIGYRSNKEALIQNTLELNRINAEKLAVTTNDLLNSAKRTLEISAAYVGEADSADDTLFSLQLIKESNNIFNSVFIADETGVTIQTIPETIGLIGKKLESEAATVALRERIPLISEPYIGITGRYIIMVSHPIFDPTGSYKGFIGGSIYLSEPNVLEVMLGSSSSNAIGSYVYVVSKKGELLYHPDKLRIGEEVNDNGVVQNVLAGFTGAISVTNTKGISMLAGYAPVDEVGWGIISQTPAATVISASNELVVKIIIYSAPVMLAVLIIVILLTRFISLPLYKLANFAENLSSDHPRSMHVPVIHNWNYEANELHKTMQKAINSMQSQINVLSFEAQKDTLTSLNNRRTMDKVLAEWSRNQVPFSYIIIDIDHFKNVNDTYGHQRGDEVLTFLAVLLMESSGIDDICCRYGGEEFVILTPGTDLDYAYLLAEKIRKAAERTESPIGKSITISAGIAASSRPDEEIEAIMGRADAALYQSKQAGRNRVTVSKHAALIG